MTDTPRSILLRAAAARDATGVDLRPAAVLVQDDAIAAVGPPAEVQRLAGHADVMELPDTLLLPAMVNAHAHLDLTSLGRQPYQGNFGGWVGGVMHDRPADEQAILKAVTQGLQLSRDAGVGWVGDVAGSDAAARAFLQASASCGVGGVTWLECFGIGARAAEAAVAAAGRGDALRSTHSVRVDLQPHAPYSAGLPLYEAAARRPHAGPSTHLAETQDEARFVRDAAGPFADLLRRLAKWDDSITPRRRSPVEHLADVLAMTPWVVAHCNYVSDEDIAILAATRTSVAYCPVASEYFQHVGHRYRDMLAAGVNVCLGTDSILCQPDDAPQPLGLLSAMRRLHRRDGVEPATLLAMATTHGKRALMLPSLTATLAAGAPARVLGVRIDSQSPQAPLTQAMLSDYPVERVVWR